MFFKRLGWVVYLMAAALPAAAEVLILRDGGRVVTAGRWTVDGGVVVFTRPDGSLVSIRLKNIDLDASRSNGGEAGLPGMETPSGAPEAPARSRRPVLVLTDRDVPRATSGVAPTDGRLGGTTSGHRASPVEVESWIEREEAGGMEVVGNLRNRSRAAQRLYGVSVDLRDGDGDMIQSVYVLPKERLLAPGATTAFSARFREVGEGRYRPSFKVDSARAAGGPGEPETAGPRGRRPPGTSLADGR